jgi:hypothetical protein
MFKVISKIIISIPIKAATKRKSAIVSNCFSLFGFLVLIEMNDNIQDIVSSTAISEVSSSMICVSARLAMCNDVITKRQNPKRFADVLRMWGEVLLAI